MLEVVVVLVVGNKMVWDAMGLDDAIESNMPSSALLLLLSGELGGT